MDVKLVSLTKPCFTVDGRELTPEQLIVYVARVSSPQNQKNIDSSSKLLKYLIEHKHWSPFEMVSFCVCIKTTRAISAQIIRHKSFSFQELSQRYLNDKSTMLVSYDVQEARRQDLKNRQNSLDDLSSETKEWFKQAQVEVGERSLQLYNEAISRGIARECARFLLPLNTETTIYMNGLVRSWIHYLDIRSVEHGAQKEHYLIANKVKNDIFKPNFPSISEAMGW